MDDLSGRRAGVCEHDIEPSRLDQREDRCLLEVGQLMAMADERFAPFIALCAFAGLRLGEARRLPR